MPDSAEDLRYCRAALPRVSRTFALNIRLLPGEFRDAVALAYLLCRTADTLEDSWPGSSAEIRDRFDRLRAALDGESAAAESLVAAARALPDSRDDLDLVRELPRLLRVLRAQTEPDRTAVAECLKTMTEGMCRYSAREADRGSAVAYLDDEAELHDYCWVVAGCVGVMLTRMFFARVPPRGDDAGRKLIDLSPVVGEALQLTNILLDWPVDVRRGRTYVPAEWLRSAGLAPADLTHPEDLRVGAVAARLEGLARAALARVPDYVERIPSGHLRYRLFCLWPALWALGSLRHARRDPRFPAGPSRPRLPRLALWQAAIGSALVAHHRGLMRRLYAASG
jgi:farnesyl-diphosphate farnesyltransferase